MNSGRTRNVDRQIVIISRDAFNLKPFSALVVETNLYHLASDYIQAVRSTESALSVGSLRNAESADAIDKCCLSSFTVVIFVGVKAGHDVNKWDRIFFGVVPLVSSLSLCKVIELSSGLQKDSSPSALRRSAISSFMMRKAGSLVSNIHETARRSPEGEKHHHDLKVRTSPST